MKTEQIKKSAQFLKAVAIEKTKSAILTDKISNSIMEFPFMPEDKSNVTVHLTILAGGKDGRYVREEKTEHSLILQNKIKQDELDMKIKNWRKQQIGEGKNPNAPLAEHLLDRWVELLSQAEIYQLEKEKLESILKTFDDKQEEETAKRLLKGRLGIGKMNGGVIVIQDGQKVSIVDRLPTITDKRSPYDGLVLYRYMAEVVAPLSREWSRLQDLELKTARGEGRQVKKIPRPKLPTFDVKTGKISYEGYSERTLNKLKS